MTNSSGTKLTKIDRKGDNQETEVLLPHVHVNRRATP